MEITKKSGIGAAERSEIFSEEFYIEIDAGATLAELVWLRETAGVILGPDLADAGMAKIITPLTGSETRVTDWREALDDNQPSCFSDWPMGARLHDLAAYAYYGIALGGGDSETGAREWLDDLIQEATSFERQSPLSIWLDEGHAVQLERLMLLARNRWALDTGASVEPAALAYFGGISEGRIRNMMSGAKRAFTHSDGRVPAHEALAWLADRDAFWNSIWRDQPAPPHGARSRAPVERPAFVPVARDGSIFHPGLETGGTFTIGERGSERHVPARSAACPSAGRANSMTTHASGIMPHSAKVQRRPMRLA